MKALVYNGPGIKSLDDRPKPEIQHPADAIVKITKTTICGTDLHILKGDVPTCEPGRILGHEGVGIVEEVGAGVSSLKRGDHGSHFLHYVMREVCALPKRHVFAMRQWGLDFRVSY